MPIILCASKYHLLAHWTESLKEKPKTAKSQKELLEMLSSQPLCAPLVLLEERLYGAKIGDIIRLMREANPATAIMILTSTPTFHGGQEALALGANGYGNSYLASDWLADALLALRQGENWLYPLQEAQEPVGACAGEVRMLEGELFGEKGRPIALGEGVLENETLMLTGNSASLTIVFLKGNTLSVRGTECLYLDASVTAHIPQAPLHRLRTSVVSQAPVFSSLLDRPFYINVGKESLIDPKSSELELKTSGATYISVCPFSVEEGSGEEEEGLTFGALQVLDKKSDPFAVQLQGNIEEYEILYPKTLQGCVLVNDTVDQRDGARVVSPPIRTLNFLDAKVDVFHTSLVASQKTKQFGDFLDWTQPCGAYLDSVNIVISGYTQGVDYLLFDRTCIPEGVRFRYGMDEAALRIHFFGKAATAQYQALLATLGKEGTNLSGGRLHGRIEASYGAHGWLLFEGLIDT